MKRGREGKRQALWFDGKGKEKDKDRCLSWGTKEAGEEEGEELRRDEESTQDTL